MCYVCDGNVSLVLCNVHKVWFQIACHLKFLVFGCPCVMYLGTIIIDIGLVFLDFCRLGTMGFIYVYTWILSERLVLD